MGTVGPVGVVGDEGVVGAGVGAAGGGAGGGAVGVGAGGGAEGPGLEVCAKQREAVIIPITKMIWITIPIGPEILLSVDRKQVSF